MWEPARPRIGCHPGNPGAVIPALLAVWKLLPQTCWGITRPLEVDGALVLGAGIPTSARNVLRNLGHPATALQTTALAGGALTTPLRDPAWLGGAPADCAEAQGSEPPGPPTLGPGQKPGCSTAGSLARRCPCHAAQSSNTPAGAHSPATQVSQDPRGPPGVNARTCGHLLGTQTSSVPVGPALSLAYPQPHQPTSQAGREVLGRHSRASLAELLQRGPKWRLMPRPARQSVAGPSLAPRG